jgi:hypothetical protein
LLFQVEPSGGWEAAWESNVSNFYPRRSNGTLLSGGHFCRGTRSLRSVPSAHHAKAIHAPRWFQLLGIIFEFFWLQLTADGRCLSREEQPMGMQESLDKLRADAAEFSMIGVLAADAKKREQYARLADHLYVLASEIARAIAAKADDSTSRG